jgi:hypothetical protein
MGIQGIHSPHVPSQGIFSVCSQKTPGTTTTETTNTPPPTDATKVDISDEAKHLSGHHHHHHRNGKPREIAEALGFKNFGQAVKALREKGDLDHGFISKLLHGDADALNKAKDLLGLTPPPIPDPTTTPPTTPPTTTAPSDPVGTPAPSSSTETIQDTTTAGETSPAVA